MTIENLYQLRGEYEKELALAEAKVAVVNDIIAMELANTDVVTENDVEVDENAETATNIFSATTY